MEYVCFLARFEMSFRNWKESVFLGLWKNFLESFLVFKEIGF